MSIRSESDSWDLATSVGATATMQRFTYGEHGDPFGVFDLTGTIETSSMTMN